MAAVTGPVYIPQNPTPVVPRYGLFNVAVGPLDLVPHGYSGGIEYDVGTCSLPVGYEVNCMESHAAKTFEGAIDTITGLPFIVYSSITCSPVSLTNFGQDRVRNYLFQQLVAGEQAAVERIFSTSDFGMGAGLANNPDAVNLGSAAGIVQGVSMLEEWLYERYGLPGVLHVPMRAAAYVQGAHLADHESATGPWKTPVGTLVSFGNYAGEGPTGQAPAAGTTWLYITGQMAVFRAPDSRLLDIPVGQVLNRATNTVEIIMEREYVVTYDCHVAGVQVTLDTTDH